MEKPLPSRKRRTSSLDYNALLSIESEITLTHKPQCSCSKAGKFLKKNCNVDCRAKFLESCPKVHKWCHLTHVPQNRSEIYNQLQLIKIESDKYRKYVEQIEIDLVRTYPDIEYFTTGHGVNAMRRVLCAFVKYHYQLGYVQGMNYIVCALLWHASEVDAFWLFVVLMDEFKLRENYLFKFPGLTKHCELIDRLMALYMPTLQKHFCEYDLMVQMFSTDWLLTIFTSLVPIQFSHKILGKFINFGWIFIYKFLLTILERLEKKLLAIDDRLDMLRLIKPLELVNNDWNNFLLSLQNKREALTWEKLASIAGKKQIDERIVNNFFQNYKLEIFDKSDDE